MAREQDPRESGSNETAGPLGPAMGAAAFAASAGADVPGTAGGGRSGAGLPGGSGRWVRKEDLLAGFSVRALRSGAIVGLVAYFGSLIVALVLVMLAALGLGTADTDARYGAAAPGPGGPVPSLWTVVFPLAAQLVSMGMLAMPHANMNVFLGMVHGSVSIFAVPLLLTAVSLSALFFGSRAAGRRNPAAAGTLAWVPALAAGIVFTVLVNAFAAIFGLALPIPGVQGLSFSAADFGSFVLVFVLASAAALAGANPTWPHRRQSHPIAAHPIAAHPIASLARPALLTAGVHLGMFSLIAVPATVIVVGLKFGWAAVLSAPLWAPSAALYLFGLGQFSQVGFTRAAGSLLPWAGGGSESTFVSAFGLDQVGVPAWAGWLLVVLALVSVLAASMLWYLRRGRLDRHSITGWLPLPVAFLAIGIIVTWLSTVSVSAEASSTLGSGQAPVRGSVGIALAWWAPLLMFLWGVLAEASARYAAPRVLGLLPARAVALLAGHRAPAPGAAPVNSAPAGIAPHGPATRPSPTTAPAGTAPHGQPEYPVIPPRTPLNPRTRRRIALIGGACAAVVVLIVGGFLAVNVIKGANGPDKVVHSYLQALQDGDARKALDISDPNIPNEQRLLLTNQIFGQAAKRVDGFAILGTDIRDNAATVHAQLRQDGRSTDVDYHLAKASPELLDDHWKLGQVPVEKLTISTDSPFASPLTDTVTVNGTDVKLGPPDNGQVSRYTLPAFPGSYTIGLSSKEKYLTAAGGSVMVTVGTGQQQAPAIKLQPAPNDAFLAEAQTQVNQLLTQCALSTSLRPPGCPFSHSSLFDTRNVKWTITTMPTVSITGPSIDVRTSAWRLWARNGTATVSYEAKTASSPQPQWKAMTDKANLDFFGTATLQNGQVSVSIGG
ncbi:hypothetical protein GCM10027449_14500 [Sinomonas notoginsengisoli]|uniref:hypothetical protein n=1 Tax=Sinomonas notoginsengisoli TaxID=1457311 RepID=UPI001F3F2165|nr:hypothetical protein [Sinomonas notoginsengisoli]